MSSTPAPLLHSAPAPHEVQDLARVDRAATVGPAPRRARAVVAALVSVLAGAIHLGSAGAHADVWPPEGLAFVVVGTLQAGLGAWLLGRRRRRTGLVALLTCVHVGAITAWVMTRTVGWPVGPFRGQVEAIAVADLAATLAALAALGAIRGMGSARLPRPRRWLASGAATVIALVAAPAVAFVPALAHHAEGLGHGANLPPDTFPDGRDLRRQADDPTDGFPVHVGRGPVDVAFGHGLLWVVNGRDGSVTRVTPAGEVLDTIEQVATGPTSVAVGPDAVWVSGVDGFLVRLDPVTGQVTGRAPIGRLAKGIAVADDGVVFAASAGEGTLNRVHPDSLDVRSAPLVPGVLPAFNGPGPSAVVVDDTTVWVINTLRRELARYDAETLEPLGPATRTGPGATDLVMVDDVAWVAATTDGTLWRHDRRSGDVVGDPVVVDDLPQFGGGPAALVLAFGSLWVINNDDRTVTRVDPAAARVLGEPRFLDNFHAEVPRGAGIVGTGDGVWATDHDGNRIVRLDP